MNIFIYDEFNPEDTAMMQALYSRSSASVKEHAIKVKSTGSGKFMERFYVGYGHASIADCGSTTIFIEGVSMLVAKAIQDNAMYSGQETSSRYIDMSKQALIDPINTSKSKAVLDRWMNFYTDSQAQVETHIRARFPKGENEDQGMYDRAVKARVFDILRGFLPAGVTTQLSWHTNLRQAHDKIVLLLHHPLEEVRNIAEQIHNALKDRYKNSFGHKIYPEQEKYRDYSIKKYSYFFNKDTESFSSRTTISKKDINEYKDLLFKRPVKTNLPNFLADLGHVNYKFLLDFGSFRDIQRHRNGVCRMPLLTMKKGFHDWYLNELPGDIVDKAKKLIKEQIKALKEIERSDKNITKEILQYYIAMGFNVTCSVTYGLPAAIYTMELRSGRLVHPTLRNIAHEMYKSLKKFFPKIALHPDLSKDDWDVRRGAQDIRTKI